MKGIDKKTEVRINWRKYRKIRVQLEDFIPDLYQATEEYFHMRVLYQRKVWISDYRVPTTYQLVKIKGVSHREPLGIGRC